MIPSSARAAGDSPWTAELPVIPSSARAAGDSPWTAELPMIPSSAQAADDSLDCGAADDVPWTVELPMMSLDCGADNNSLFISDSALRVERTWQKRSKIRFPARIRFQPKNKDFFFTRQTLDVPTVTQPFRFSERTAELLELPMIPPGRRSCR